MAKPSRRPTRKEKVKEGRTPTPKYQKTIELTPQTARQEDYLTALQTSDVVIATGCAGTGKTFIALSWAAQQYHLRNIDKIVLTRPNVAAGGKSLGFFPGELEEKMAPWVQPAIDVLERQLGEQKVKGMLKAGEILIEPFETMRGRNFDNALVILDEAQNATVEQIKMFLTRIGEGSQVVVDGDTGQSDLPRDSGLGRITHMVKQQMLPVPIVEFTSEDIVRSDVCAMWIKAFEAAGL